jgi:16S rRNA (uracil1498-N3)-methyltransferase
MDYYYGIAEGDYVRLSQEEFNHLKNVRRTRPGAHVLVTDGIGHLFVAEYTGEAEVLKIVDVQTTPPPGQTLHIAIAPTKNIDRIEWFVEKAAETGIDFISFIRCRHSERKEIRTDRLMRVLISAVKQSNKSFLPVIHPLTGFTAFIERHHEGMKLIFSQGGDHTFKNSYQKNTNLIGLIGPEGDFHHDEMELAKQHGFIPTTLGNERLRTETAGLAVCTLFNFVNSQ